MKHKEINLITLSADKARRLMWLLHNRGIECKSHSLEINKSSGIESVSISVSVSESGKAIKIIDELVDNSLLDKDISETPIKLLVPIDFSDHSIKASRIAFDWLVRLKGEMTLLHVSQHDLSYFNFGENPFLKKHGLPEGLKHFAHDKLLSLQQDYITEIKNNRIQGVNVFTEFGMALPERYIKDYAELYNPSFIVMGTRDVTTKANDLIGSVTAEIIDTVRFPIFVVPQCYKYIGVDKFKTITYLSNFSDYDYMAIKSLNKFSFFNDIEINCVHFTNSKNYDNDVERLNQVKEYFSHTNFSNKLNFSLLKASNIYDGFKMIIDSGSTELLAFTSENRSGVLKFFTHSKARKLLAASTLPFFVFNQ